MAEWIFALPAGSKEEPIIMATVASLDGHRTVGIAVEESLIGAEYLRTTGVACKEAGLRITAEVPIPQVQTEKRSAMEELAVDRPDAILHVGFGLGISGMNEALEAIGRVPSRYTTTAFEFAATNQWWRKQLAGWVGLDPFDERNEVARGFLDRFEARHGYRPEYFFPSYCYDFGRMMLLAIAGAKPLTGEWVEEFSG
jgi:branched-chain amino acid transport system substrate-binding protein